MPMPNAVAMSLDRRELTQEQLTAELRALHEGNAELRVFIHGDESARLGLAITVRDAAPGSHLDAAVRFNLRD